MNASPPTSKTAGKGLLLVISGPSGVGKTTIVREVEKQLGGSFSVSATTRPKAAGEVDGRDYRFLTEDEFHRMIDRNEFLEHACVFGKYLYGTPRQPVEDTINDGGLVILDIDVQGARQIKEAMPEAYTIFILPPSEEALLERLRKRARDEDAAIQRRFAVAREEITFAKNSGCYDAMVVNDDLDAAIRTTVDLVRSQMVSGR